MTIRSRLHTRDQTKRYGHPLLGPLKHHRRPTAKAAAAAAAKAEREAQKRAWGEQAEYERLMKEHEAAANRTAEPKKEKKTPRWRSGVGGGRTRRRGRKTRSTRRR